MEFLHIIAKKLLEVETISGKDFETMYNKYMGIEEEKEETTEETIFGEENTIEETSNEENNVDSTVVEKTEIDEN